MASASSAREPSELESLVTAAAAGDRGALAVLLRRLAPRMVRVAYGVLHSREDAEDAAQEGMLVLSRSLSRLAEPRAIVAYASRVVLRIALRVRGRRERRQTAPISAAHTDDAAGDASASLHETIERRQRVERALQLLGRLPEEQAEVMLMRFVEGYTVAEVAGALEISFHTVTSRVRLAKQRLRRMASWSTLTPQERTDRR